MAQIIIEAKGKSEAFSLKEPVTTLGRIEDNDIVLEDPSVSRKHARITREEKGFFLEDLGSGNGTFVNGSKITKEQINDNDSCKVGAVSFTFKEGAEPGISASTVAFEKAKTPKSKKAPNLVKPVEEDAVVKLKRDIHLRLLEKMNLKRTDLSKSDDVQLRKNAQKEVEEIILELNSQVLQGLKRETLVEEILDSALGLGPLEDLLSDPEITEIMVNNKDQIYVEKHGKLELSDKKFFSEEQILAAIERIVAPIGRRIDESMPMVDARLKDGSRVNAIIMPISLKGPALTIRKFSHTPFEIEDLIRFGTLNKDIAEFIELCVKIRENMVISGGTGSGKTSLLNVFSSFIPHDERIVTIEDSAELKLSQEHVVPLESRSANIEGKGAITIRDLVRNALRMRPDRIVVGECRGGEALDMLQAMNTGHDGSLTTAHANSPRDTLSRLETMVLMSGMDLPMRAIREQISSAINIIVQTARLSDGSRKVTSVTEVTGMEGDVITLQDIFIFKQTGLDAQAKVLGKFVATGFVPRFIEEVKAKGVQINMKIFQDTE